MEFVDEFQSCSTVGRWSAWELVFLANTLLVYAPGRLAFSPVFGDKADQSQATVHA